MSAPMMVTMLGALGFTVGAPGFRPVERMRTSEGFSRGLPGARASWLGSAVRWAKAQRSHLLFALVLLISANAFAQESGARKPATAPAQKPSTAAKPAAGWQHIPIPPLHEFHPQQPKRIELANGMVIFLQEDHELPLIGGSFTIRGGGLEVPNSKTGMMSLYGGAWRTGGTEKRTGDELDDYLESRAASIETSGGMDSCSLSWSSLKNDFHDVFPVALDLLQHPAFRQDKIDLLRTRLNGTIERRNDDVDSILGRETSKIAYGADNPYGREMEFDTLAAVTRQDLLNFHQRHLAASNIILSVAGDFDPAEMERTLRAALESWPRGERNQAPRVEFHNPAPGIYLAEKTDVNQAAIRMVHLGIERNNPDLFAVDVMDQIFFSGGFSARFTEAIRTKRGLAYAAGGSISAPFSHPGLFAVGAGTKSTTAVETVSAMRQEVENIFKQPATSEELKRAKDSILNSFVFRFDSAEKVLAERVTYEFYGFPADFLERYRAGVEKVTLDDVARVAKKYIHPEQLATVVVGNSAEFDKPLSTVGRVTKLDISIPPPGGLKKGGAPAAAAPSAAQPNTPEARALLAKVLDSMGGATKLQSVKALMQIGTATQKTEQGDLELQLQSLVVFPDQIHTSMQAPMGSMVRVVTPKLAYVSMGDMGTRDLPPSVRDDAIKDLRHSPFYVAQHLDDAALKVALAGTQKVGEIETQVLALDAGGVEFRWCIDPKSGHVVRQEYQGTGQGGPAQIALEHSEFKTVDGITLSYAINQFQNGQLAATIHWNQILLNPKVDPKLFEKPEAPK